jgi:hypothetical protein
LPRPRSTSRSPFSPAAAATRARSAVKYCFGNRSSRVGRSRISGCYVALVAQSHQLWQATSHGAMRALWKGRRGAFPLLSLVRGSAAQEDGRVLHAAPARRRKGATRDAIPDGRSTRPLQRVGRKRRCRRRRLARRARSGQAGPLLEACQTGPRAKPVGPLTEASTSDASGRRSLCSAQLDGQPEDDVLVDVRKRSDLAHAAGSEPVAHALDQLLRR